LSPPKKQEVTPAHLKKKAQQWLRAAKSLYKDKNYDISHYNCGYAVEAILKYRICKTLGWAAFTASAETFKAFKTHKLQDLLHVSGVEQKITQKFTEEWSIVAQWDPESRYLLDTQTAKGAKLMIDATENLLKNI
jgi:HEPN domain-containing protein